MPIPSAPSGTPDGVAASYLAHLLDHDPVGAMELGIYDRAGDVAVPSQAALDATARSLDALIAEAEALPAQEVATDVDRRGLLAFLSHQRLTALHERPFHRNPTAAVEAASVAALVPVLRTHLDPDVRERAVRGACEGVPAVLAGARDLLELNEVPPLWARLGRQGAEGTVGFFRDVVPGAVPAAAEAAEAAAQAFEVHAAWISEEVVPAAKGAFSIGPEALGELLTQAHLQTDDAAAIVRRGEALRERLEDELREVAGKEDWLAALTEAKADHVGVDGIVDAYRAELDRSMEFCFANDLVTDPGVPARLTETPEFLRPVFGYAAYLSPGALATEGTGELWVTPPSDPSGMVDHSAATIPAITVHEGYPGHHLQLSTVSGLDSIVRRLHLSNLMIEGWGLYVEELMAEVGGYYSRPARLGQLALSVWRAARIVVDVRLAAGDLGIDEAVAIVRGAGLAEPTARAEVSRYTMMPTQPFTYLLGAEEIRALRGTWMARHDASLRGFHDALLSCGHLHPTLAGEVLLADPTGS